MKTARVDQGGYIFLRGFWFGSGAGLTFGPESNARPHVFHRVRARMDQQTCDPNSMMQPTRPGFLGCSTKQLTRLPLFFPPRSSKTRRPPPQNALAPAPPPPPPPYLPLFQREGHWVTATAGDLTVLRDHLQIKTYLDLRTGQAANSGSGGPAGDLGTRGRTGVRKRPVLV